MAKKAPDAFRTISEVSEALDTPAHVLRFWESKFSQIKPVKRAGGRRYYRPSDIDLLSGIKTLLHEQGMTIKGAQKLLREKGVKHVAAIAPIHAHDDGEVASTPKPAEKVATAKDQVTDVADAPTKSAPAAAAASIDLPPLPSPPTDIPPGLLSDLAGLPIVQLRAQADKIRPAVAALEAVHARMTAS